MATSRSSPRSDGMLIRTARTDDDAALVRLAALDSARPLTGPTLVAEQDGAIVAALSLSTGRAVADPFVPSLHIVEMLREYARRRHAPAATPRARPLLLGAKPSW